MNSPIAEGAVGEVEVLTEAAGVDARVERPLGGGAEPEIPVHAFRGFAIRGFDAGSAGGVGERPDHADFADLAGLQKRHAGDGMGRDAAVEAHLH